MHQENKWEGLLDIDEPNEPAPHRPHGRAAVCALIAAACLLACVSWWMWTRAAPTPLPTATPTGPASTSQDPAPDTPTPASTRATSATPTPTPSPTVDVFVPARDTARSWIERFYIEREGTTWTQIAQRLTSLQTWAMGAYMAEHPDAQVAPLNIHHVDVAYSDETADVEHPTTWSATATITLDTGAQVRARITVIPDPDTVEGGWKVDQWQVLP